MAQEKDSVIVIGAGIGGLASALRLVAQGVPVTVLEAQAYVGGKMRTTPSPAGPVDAGPTVLTMKHVFDDLFAAAGARLEDHLTLTPLPVIARHFWADGARLDLHADRDANRDAIGEAFGAQAAQDFAAFDMATSALYDAFKAPIMQAARPDALGAARAMIAQPRLMGWLRPGLSLATKLQAQFGDPRLAQLFGRYATYVGGNPLHAPALLALIWQAEAAGVWSVKGGMAQLAQVLAGLIEAKGGVIRLQSPVARLVQTGGRISAVQLACGEEIAAAQVIFNGDPAALHALLPHAALPARQTQPRSLSANVWTFSAEIGAQGLGRDALAYHSVFFADDAAAEFGPLSQGRRPQEPTIYICAQDRAEHAPSGPERFQFILNAPALPMGATREDKICPDSPFPRLERFGLHMTRSAKVVTRPQDFAALFPHSQGALYGLSPNSPLATFLRPQARGRIRGLYLAGGGAHPGAGVPMATLSGQFAAAAVLSDRISAAKSRRTAMPGGISTASATTVPAPSRS